MVKSPTVKLVNIVGWIPVVCVLVAALGVRLLGIRLGLPYLHHWDECWVVWSARNMLQSHSDVPTSYQYGATLSYLIAWVVRASLWFARQYHLGDDDVTLRWVGRIISASISATGALALYFVGRTAPPKIGNSRRIGLYAALSFAFAYELVTQARYAVTDACVVSLCAWTFAASAMYSRTRRVEWAILSLVAAGVAFAFKFPALPVVLVPLACILAIRPATHRSSRWPQVYLLLAAGPLVLTCFIGLNPHFIDHWPQASHDLMQRMAQTRDGGFSYYYRRRPGFDHLSSALIALFARTLSRYVALSCFLAVLSLVGLFIGVRHRFTIVAAGAVHALVVILGFSLATSAFLLRNYLVVVPIVCLSLGLALESFSQWCARLAPRVRWTSACGHLLSALVLATWGGLTIRDSIMNEKLSRDTRILALDWIRDHSGGRRETVSLTPSVLGPPEQVGSNILQYLQTPLLHFKGRPTDCRALAALAPKFLVSSSFRGQDVPSVPFVQRWYISECAGYERVVTFEANPYEATLALYPTWAGRVSTIVLARKD